ncbi:PREDICTED: uncharacterized protein LOC106123072 [Papilio xuthus]|uniref:Uncharacterized protein LOC106123072 n=1 Tax=Papilio xuthus TaxID=66420 RepID=A0AAJ7EEW8_PAPXU|nr:PREDICTED: uncharacterized protein LOC106123072 [Papilio xuthus]
MKAKCDCPSTSISKSSNSNILLRSSAVSPADNVILSPGGSNDNVTLRKNATACAQDREQAEYVTERSLREIMKNEMADMLKVFIQQHVTEQFITATNDLCKKMEKLTSTLENFNARMSNVEERVAIVEKRLDATVNREDSAAFANLQAKLNQCEQACIANDLEITGLPEEKNESPLHLTSILAKKLGVTLDERDIVSAERVGRKTIVAEYERGKEEDATAARPRALVVRLVQRGARDELLRAARVRRGFDSAGIVPAAAPRRVYVNERLTRLNKQLFYRAREESRRLKWKFAWTKNGTIFVRRDYTQTAIRIRDHVDIVRVFSDITVSPI